MTPRRRGAVGGLIGVVAVALAAAPAFAQGDDAEPGPAEVEPPPPTEVPVAPDAGKTPDEKKKKKDGKDKAEGTSPDGEDDSKPGPADDGKKKAPVEVDGRVFVREELVGRPGRDWTGELRLDSVRLGATYQWKERLRVQISLEANTDATALIRDIVRDAYVELVVAPGVAIRGGRFKLPISAIESTSAWRLPTIDRGIVSEIIGEGVVGGDPGIDLAGRRDGVGLDWTVLHAMKPRLELVASQVLDETGVAQERPLSAGAGLDLTARVSIRPTSTLEVGAVGSWRGRELMSGDVPRYWTTGLDATLDIDSTADKRWGLRIWGDLLFGKSIDRESQFLSAQVIAGWRHGGEDKGEPYVEPFTSLAYFNDRIDVSGDSLGEVIAGVAGGRWRRWRVQAQFAALRSYLEEASSPIIIPDRTKVQIQLGAAF